MTVSSQSLSHAVLHRWIDTYLDTPGVIVHDAGNNLMAKPFVSNADLLHIHTEAVPDESANSMKDVERYHPSIRCAYQIIKFECPDTDDSTALQTAVMAINISVAPDRSLPTLVLYGALPCLGLPHNKPHCSTFQCTAAHCRAKL